MAALSTIIDELTALASDVGALGDQRTRDLDATHTPTTASQLEVATTNGAIDLHPTEGDELVVDAVAKTRHEDDDLDAVALDIAEADDTLTVTVDIPDTNRGTTVELDVGVPDSLAVALVETKNGKIDVRGVRGDARIEAKNGKISVDDVDGMVDVHAKNGAISISDTYVTSATSKNGRLDLNLPVSTPTPPSSPRTGHSAYASRRTRTPPSTSLRRPARPTWRDSRASSKSPHAATFGANSAAAAPASTSTPRTAR